jgi:ribosomal protein L11 methyltransferase
MSWLELTFKDLLGLTRDMIVYTLAENGFESFSESGDDLCAYIPSGKMDPQKIKQLCQDLKVTCSLKEIREENWNSLWEQSYEPVGIAGRCRIRAPFHLPSEEFEYELVIAPRMSFGTAHHETTALMIGIMLDMHLAGKRVLDMGCGTGILAILADRMGAREVLAVDNDEWAFHNATDNVAENNSLHVTVKMGDTDVVQGPFDVILANINRNVLLDQLPAYAGALVREGDLVISGFYEEDIDHIRRGAEGNGFRLTGSVIRNRWMACEFIRL